MHINRYKHTLVQIEPCHVVSTKWHRTLISTCLQDCWFWLDSIIFRCRQQQKNAAQGVPRKNGSLEAPGSVLEKNSGFAANFAEKLAWRPHHVLEPADKSAWFPTHGRFKWDVPWRLEETFDTARTSHDVQHKNQQHVPFQKKHASFRSSLWTSCRL